MRRRTAPVTQASPRRPWAVRMSRTGSGTNTRPTRAAPCIPLPPPCPAADPLRSRRRAVACPSSAGVDSRGRGRRPLRPRPACPDSPPRAPSQVDPRSRTAGAHRPQRHPDALTALIRRVVAAPGTVAALADAAANAVVAAAACSAGVDLTIGGEPIPILGLPELTLVLSLVGVLLAAVLARLARRPRPHLRSHRRHAHRPLAGRAVPRAGRHRLGPRPDPPRRRRDRHPGPRRLSPPTVAHAHVPPPERSEPS